MKRRAPLLLALALTACAPPTPPLAPLLPSAPPVASPPPAVPASSPLLALVPPAAMTVVHVDWKAMRASPVYPRLLAELTRGRVLDPGKPHCVALPDAVDEVVVAFTGEDRSNPFLILQAHDESVVRACMSELGVYSSDTQPPVAGHPVMAVDNRLLAVFADGLFMVGNRSDLELALSPSRRAQPLAPLARDLDVSPPVVVSLHRAAPPELVGAAPISMVLETDARHLSMRASGALDSPVEAAAFVFALTKMRDRLAEMGRAGAGGKAAILQRIVASLHFAAEGARVHVEIEVNGGAEDQIELALLLPALGLATHEHEAPPAPPELVAAKEDVLHIEAALRRYMAGKDAKQRWRTRFPPSAPATPAQVPRKGFYTPTARTWAHPTWKALGFKIERPLAYSYEILTSDDGKTATVAAHGDLDGDGKVSTIELTIHRSSSGEIDREAESQTHLVVIDELE